MRISPYLFTALLALPLCSCANAIGDAKLPPDSLPAVSRTEGGADSVSDSTDETADGSGLYDVTPIAQACKSGDSTGLSGIQTDIFNKVNDILDEIITEDMSDYEKELAVHDYLISNCQYDKGALRVIPRPGENADNPYGALIDGQAICSGYTTTFSLFMQIFDIPCIVIHSTDIENDEHAWNAVELDGNWYYVDVTWDDPVPDGGDGMITHEYFNATREHISERHILTKNSPETNSLEYTYDSQCAVSADNADIAAEFAKAHNSDSITIKCADKKDELSRAELKKVKSALKADGLELYYRETVDTADGKAVHILLY